MSVRFSYDRASVWSDNDLEIALGQHQQTPIMDATPAHLLDGLHLVARQVAPQPPIEALVKEHVHVMPAPVGSPWRLR